MRILSLAAAATAAILAISSPAQASVTISFTGGNSALDGTDGNIRSFGPTGGIRVQGSAFDYNPVTNAIQTAYLGWYSSGLGVTNPNENGLNNTHTTDNQGQYDFILLVFNQAVNIQSAVLTPFSVGGSTDNDALISYATLANAFTSPNPTAIGLNSPVWSMLTSHAWDVTGNTNSPYSVPFNSSGDYGNVWLIGAADPNPDSHIDGFKISSIVVNTPPALPEPGTWAMMLLGFGAVGFALRKSRKNDLGLAQIA
jgi:hypothetical protein